jgi:hypothetical protein
MGLTSNTVSYQTIISKLYRDLQLKDEQDIIGDILEWTAEALEFIGVYDQYESKPATITIVNYKGEKPCDFIALEQTTYNNYPIVYNTGIQTPKDTSINYGYLTPYSYNQEKINNGLLFNGNYRLANGETFKIESSWFKTSFEKGELNIVYKSVIVDTDGFPLIPDNVSYKEALYWYIVYKINYAQARKGEIAASFYTDAYDKWLKYCNQAGANAMMPDLTMLENIKRSFISLRPNLYKFNSQFSNGSK